MNRPPQSTMPDVATLALIRHGDLVRHLKQALPDLPAEYVRDTRNEIALHELCVRAIVEEWRPA